MIRQIGPYKAVSSNVWNANDERVVCDVDQDEADFIATALNERDDLMAALERIHRHAVHQGTLTLSKSARHEQEVIEREAREAVGRIIRGESGQQHLESNNPT